MKTSKKKTLIILLCVLVVLISGIITLKFWPHGKASYARINSSSYDLSTFTKYEDTKLDIKDSAFYNSGKNEKDESLTSYAVILDNYVDYSSLSEEGKLNEDSIDSDFFKSNKLLIISREGSYYQLSEVKKASIKDNSIYQVTYYIEDAQIVNNKPNKKGIYCFDLFKLDVSSSLTSLNITDKTF